MIAWLGTVYVLLIGLAVAGTRLAIRLRRTCGRPFLGAFQAYVALTFAYALLNFVGEGVVSPAFLGSSETLMRISVVVDLFTVPLLGGVLGLLVLWVARFRWTRVPGPVKALPPAIMVLFLGVACADFLAYFGAGTAGSVAVGAAVVHAVAAGTLLLAVVLLLTGGRTREDETRRRLSLSLGVIYAFAFGILAAVFDSRRVLSAAAGSGHAFAAGLTVLVNFPALLYLGRVLGRSPDGAPKGAAAVPGWAERALAAGLTDREREIVARVAAGKRNGEIGRELFIAPKTVKNHITAIYAKTGLRNRVQLANFYRAEPPSASEG